jgi:uncharacterized Tic20 family protein
MTIWLDRVETGSGSYPLADLSAAQLIADPNPATAPGVPAPPAVWLQLQGGTSVTLVPAYAADAWKILDVIYTYRSDLRNTLPPPPDLGARVGQAGASFFSDPSNERIFAGVAHLSIFFLPIVLPLILWLVLKDKLRYASDQAKQALWFHILYPVALLALFLLVGVVTAVIVILTGALGLAVTPGSVSQGSPLPLLPVFSIGGILGAAVFFIFWIGILALSIGSIILAITGAIRAFDGRPFHYPFLGRI